MKFDLEDIMSSMQRAKTDGDTQDAVIKELQKLQEELEKNKEPVERTKKQFVILANTDNELISETPMWIMQIEEDVDHNEVHNMISKAQKVYADSTRRKKNEVDTVGKALSGIPKKDFKVFGLGVKTTEPVIVLTYNEPAQKED